MLDLDLPTACIAILVTLGAFAAAHHLLAGIGVVMDHLFGLGCC
jgi:hypothetical protein